MPEYTQYESFKNAVLEIAVEAVAGRGTDDLNAFDGQVHPKWGKPFFCLTFFLSDEPHIDVFIRMVRNRLLKWPKLYENENNDGFIYKVNKSHIQSHGYWSVSFWLADSYELIEDSQP